MKNSDNVYLNLHKPDGEPVPINVDNITHIMEYDLGGGCFIYLTSPENVIIVKEPLSEVETMLLAMGQM